jgi:hypothetical protein
MSASPQHLEAFKRGLVEALSLGERSPRDVELRLLRVPALNFEGLWLAGESEERDEIVPLRAVGRLEPNRPVPLSEALNALKDAARPLSQMDDTMGA